MRRLLRIISPLIALPLAVVLLTAAPGFANEVFRFIALGDMPYGEPDKVYPVFRALIGAINQRNPEFTIHVGDIKSGTTPCTDQALRDQLDFMNSIESPVLYTPGDNEWTDCHRAAAGGYDPLERLAFIRKTFFARSRTLGKTPMKIERQADAIRDFGDYVENARFAKNGVHVITAHVVGSNNNFEVRDKAAVSEFFKRDRAAIAWLTASFDKAMAEQAKAVVLAIHADMFETAFVARKQRFLWHSGYKNFAEKLIEKARLFGRPVLLLYGDGHVFGLDRPLSRHASNILALEVHGPGDMHAVEVEVDPNDPAVFSVRQIINPDAPD